MYLENARQTIGTLVDHRKLVYHTLPIKCSSSIGKIKQVKTSSWLLGGHSRNAPSHGRLNSTPERHVNSCPSKRVCTFRRVVFNGDSSSACLRLFLHQIKAFKACWAAQCRRRATGSRQRRRTCSRRKRQSRQGRRVHGSLSNLLACLIFEVLEFELKAYRRGSPWG